MKYGDYVPVLFESIFGVTVFFGLFSVETWGFGEQLFFGGVFLSMMFAIDVRGLWSDDQYLQLLKLLMAGSTSNQEQASEEVSSVLKRSQFEHNTGLMAYSVATVLGKYIVWIVLGWGVHALSSHGYHI
jgi:hypothetical protein